MCKKKAFISHPGLREGCHSDQTSIAGRPGAAEPGSLCSFELYIRPRTPLRPAYLPLVGSVSIAMGMEAQPWMGASPANASVGGKPTQEPPPPAENLFFHITRMGPFELISKSCIHTNRQRPNFLGPRGPLREPLSVRLSPAQFLLLTDILVSVAQIKKFQKQGAFLFEFCFWEDPPTFFYRYLAIGRSNKKKRCTFSQKNAETVGQNQLF